MLITINFKRTFAELLRTTKRTYAKAFFTFLRIYVFIRWLSSPPSSKTLAKYHKNFLKVKESDHLIPRFWSLLHQSVTISSNQLCKQWDLLNQQIFYQQSCVILQLQYDDIPTTYLVLPVEIVKACIYNASLDISSLMYFIFQPINDQDIRPS